MSKFFERSIRMGVILAVIGFFPFLYWFRHLDIEFDGPTWRAVAHELHPQIRSQMARDVLRKVAFPGAKIERVLAELGPSLYGNEEGGRFEVALQYQLGPEFFGNLFLVIDVENGVVKAASICDL